MPFPSLYIAFFAAMRSLAVFSSRTVFSIVLSRSCAVLCVMLANFLASTLSLSASPSAELLMQETFTTIELSEIDLALGFLPLWSRQGNFKNEELPLFSSFAFLSNQSAPTPVGEKADDDDDHRLPMLQDTTRRAQPTSTTSATLRATNATLSTNALVPIRIPLLAEPALHLDELADSLNVRRSAAGGAMNRTGGTGIENIPFSGQSYNFQAQFDSTFVSTDAIRMRLRDKLLGTEYRPAQTLPLDEYLTQRREYIRQQTQDSILHQYDFRRPFRLELGSLLSQANNFKIPFAQNPLTTIFGKPELRLNVNLEINLRIGSQWNGTVGVGQASTLGAVQWVPIFQPNVQANVDAKLGDKFNINLDMNTLRQFEFDNLTRLAYDGDPDEIFRRIEFGNVTLNSPSAFIGGSQALFGVRTDFQFGPVYLKTVASLKRGQSRVATVKGGSVKQAISLRAYDYADNHFFLNIDHKLRVWPIFERGGLPIQPTGTVNPQLYRVAALEVWESTSDLRDIQASDVIAIDSLRPLTFNGADPVVNGTPTYSKSDKQAIFDTTKIRAGAVERGRFLKLKTERYTFDENLGTIRILNLRQDRTYAVAYRLEGATQAKNDDLVYGTFQNTLDPTDSTKLVLQLLYRPNMQPSFKKIWARQRQNVYFIGATNVSTDPKDTRIGFYFLRKNNDSTDLMPDVNVKLATVLGVDKVNNTGGTDKPDGIFDIHLPYIFDKTRGEITFTSLEPFRKGLVDFFTQNGKAELAEQYTFGAVYDTTRIAAKLNAGRDRFVISGEVSGQASNRINLPNAFNLAPGGVKVKLNGAPLVEFQDYRVEYFTGQVEILNPQALLPNANVEVEYEQNDAFNLATRSMLGVRLDLDTKSFLRSRDVRLDLGLTVVNYTQDNPSARIRLGEEPLSNTMVGIDGQTTLNADWLTKALDWLPFYDTKAASTITAKGEVAFTLSQPNTRPSEITSDNGAPTVYIDDFEATQRVYALGTQPSQWRYASPPDRNGIPSLSMYDRADSVQNYRGAVRWYAFNEGRVPPPDVYPNRAVAVGIGGTPPLRPLEINFNPFERGIYNPNPYFLDSITFRANPAPAPNGLGDTAEYNRLAKDPMLRNALFAYREQPKIWGGIMRTLSAFNLNFDNENMDFIEIVMRVNQRDPETKMYIDVGQISEDVIPNGRLDTEDGILPGRDTPNGRIANDEAGEDVGIDGLNDDQEKAQDTLGLNIPPLIKAKLPQGKLPYTRDFVRNEPDPARDNFDYDARRFSTVAANAQQKDTDFVKFNGLQGNSAFIDSQFPDSEVLNANNGQIIAQANDYFRYEVNFTTDRSNPQFVNSTPAGFITLRIPLRGNRTSVGSPLFTNIQYVRALWMGGRFKAQIVDWRFVGSQWVRQPVLVGPNTLDSTTLSVGFVGREENAGDPYYYVMPPGVQPPIDRNNFLNPNQFRNEQSLLLKFTGLRQGEERSVSRFFRPFDAFFYKQMKFFLHGGENLTRTPTNRREAQAIAFVRFGVDTSNYYEYSAPLKEGWQEITIKLDTLTGAKPVAQLNGSAADLTIVALDSLQEYRIKGSPTLTRIQFINYGIRNPSESPSELTTTMWVDELRLVQPDATRDLTQSMAAVGAATVKLADFGTATGTINMQTPYFHRLEERFGNRNLRSTLALTGQFAFERFLPESWAGSSLPVSVTYNKSSDAPRFLPQNDVNLGVAATNEASRRNPGADVKTRDSIANVIARSQGTYLEDIQVALTGARLNIPLYFFLFRDFLNRITVDYNYVYRKEESPVVALKTFEGWRFRMGYSHNFTPLPVKPFGWAENIPVLSALSGWTIFPYMNTFGASLDANQSLQREESRIQPDARIPNVLNFETTRQLQFSWKLEENGFLNPTWDYSVSTLSSLVPLWIEPGSSDVPLPASEVRRNISSLFGGSNLLNLGTNTKHAQNFRLSFRPRFPDAMGGAKFFTLTGNFGTLYGWERLLRPTNGLSDDINKSAGYQNMLNATFGVRLKDLGNTLFPALGSPQGFPQGNTQLPPPTLMLSTQASLPDIGGAILRATKSALFDWEQLTFTFTQQSNASNPGVSGETGWGNFRDNPSVGPSLSYQLGLVQEPHNTIEWGASDKFPWILREKQGPRPVGLALPDLYKQTNSLEVRTQREIIPGLQIELSWLSKVELNRNRIAQQLPSDTVPTYSNEVTLQTYGRSFFVLVNPFDPLERVVSLYSRANDTITARRRNDSTQQRQNALNDAFLNGLEGLNFWEGTFLRQVLPNLNYALRWNGLDQLPFLKGVLRSGSLESKYVGRYTATRRREAGIETLDQQTVTSSFEPLVGVTAQFDDKFVEGVMSGNLRWGNKSSYAISQSQQGVVQSEVSNDITMQINYTRRGFELPKIGGLSLLKLIGIDFEFTNDIEFGLQFTYRDTRRSSINVLPPTTVATTGGTTTNTDPTKNDPRRIDGTTNILFEPSMRYTISKQVSARLFFKYEANLTEGAAAPGSTTTVVGVDLRLNLSGGRSF